ncbi:MAG: hypothetical protein KGN84_03170, partial [Acidobacteriota bacterium]|nr:hypothetical protein [Acidobacteriota bacterium]
ARLASLTTVNIEIGTLPGLELGSTHDGVITISANAEGWCWFVDPTPGGNSEFALHASNDVLYALPGSAAYGHMDLLSTVLHELGNAMGLPEDQGQDVTGMVLSAGERRLPSDFDATAFNLAAAAGPTQLGAAASPWTKVGGSGLIVSPKIGATPDTPASIDWMGGATGQTSSSTNGNDRDGIPAWLAAFLNQAEDDFRHEKPNAGMLFRTTDGAH